MAELHVIGQVKGGKNFGKTGLFCRWAIQAGSSWKKAAGVKEGQTQVDTPVDFEQGSHWCHPIDIHFVSKGIAGWPKLLLEVYRQDQFGRSDLAGYGVCHIPSSPGTHVIEVPTWRPSGTVQDEVARYFLGGSTELSQADIIGSSADRFRLKTLPSGIVSLELSVILRNFDRFGVESY